MPAPDDALAPGELIDGRYRVEAPLGAGGMGVVVRARDVDLDRAVAIKAIRADATSDGQLATFLRDEARALAALRSPHVVPIHAFGRHRGRLFFVMDLVPGRPLAAILDEHAAAGLHVPLEVALGVLDGIAAGLDDVHAAGLQHRDVKPENVLVEEGSGRAMLIDLGLVAPCPAPHEALGGESLDRPVHGGTPGYIAPELCLGGGRPTPAADVYAFACTAFEVLTGRGVFAASTCDELLVRHALAPAPAPSSIRGELAPIDHVMARALAKDPADRPATCGELARALREGLCVAAVVERSFRPSSAPPAAPASGVAEGIHLLVADPDPAGARLVTRAAAFVFHGLGLRVGTTGDVRCLLSMARVRRPDLVVADGDAAWPLLEVLLALGLVNPGAPLRVIVRTFDERARAVERFAPFGPVDVMPRAGGIAAALAALEEVACREGLLDGRGGVGPRALRL